MYVVVNFSVTATGLVEVYATRYCSNEFLGITVFLYLFS